MACKCKAHRRAPRIAGMKKLSISKVATLGVGAAAGAIGTKMLSDSLPSIDPLFKNLGLVVVGAAVATTAKAGSVVQAAGTGAAGMAAIGLASMYGLVPGSSAPSMAGGYAIRGNSYGQLPTIGRDGQNMQDGILGTPHTSDFNGNGSWA